MSAPTFARPEPERPLRPGTRAYLIDGLLRAQGPLVYQTLDVTKECAADSAVNVHDYAARRLARDLTRAADGRELGPVRFFIYDLDAEEEPARRMLGFIAYAVLLDRAERGDQGS